MTLFPEPEPDAPGSLVYRSELAELWLGDAADVLPRYETESLGLLLTDPPYGVEWQSNRRAEAFDQLDGDGADPEARRTIAEVLTHGVRLVAQNRHLYVFGPADVLDGLKVSKACELIWDKATMSGGDLTAPFGAAHERITFAVSKHNHAGQAGNPAVPVRLRKGSVLTFPRPTGRNVRHPSEKPVPLLRELIESSSRQGETILDPFAGSGSTGVAALLSGRRAVLVERDPQWATLAAERLARTEQHVAAGRSL